MLFAVVFFVSKLQIINVKIIIRITMWLARLAIFQNVATNVVHQHTAEFVFRAFSPLRLVHVSFAMGVGLWTPSV